MDLRWSHQGVSLHAPVRNARRLRQLAVGLVVGAAALTIGFFHQLGAPDGIPEYAACADRDARQVLAQCEAIRPTFETWRYRDVEDYVSARACTLDDFEGADLVGYTRAQAGIGDIHNLSFLRMAAHQTGDCPIEVGWREQAETEWEALVDIENAYWTMRIQRARQAAEVAFARQVFVRDLLLRTWFLWLPSLLFAWIVVLVGMRRLFRLAQPLSLNVHTGGVELDGRRIPRDDIAFLSLEGQRLRIERWEGTPVFSRALPVDALVHADEICAALGLLDDDTSSEVPAPAALRSLLAGHRR